MTIEATKKCSKCKSVKPIGDFYSRKEGAAGTRPWCKPCCRKDRKRFKSTTTQKRAQHLRHRYKINDEEYRRMLKEQNGKCAICGCKTYGRKGVKRFAVDHDHATGAIRGLLCASCNQALGR